MEFNRFRRPSLLLISFYRRGLSWTDGQTGGSFQFESILMHFSLFDFQVSSFLVLAQNGKPFSHFPFFIRISLKFAFKAGVMLEHYRTLPAVKKAAFRQSQRHPPRSKNNVYHSKVFPLGLAWHKTILPLISSSTKLTLKKVENV